jgi:uncharacterized membrane protein YvlD (DUF360 family)
VTASLSRTFDLGLGIDGFWPAFWAGILIGIVSTVLSLLVGEGRVKVKVVRE